MGIQDHRANYRAALHVATSDLNDIYREFEQLQLRKEMMEKVVSALHPFLESTAEVSTYRSVPAPVEERQYEVTIPAAFEPRERIAPASFAPVPDLMVDPIQSRINRALGLAVA